MRGQGTKKKVCFLTHLLGFLKSHLVFLPCCRQFCRAAFTAQEVAIVPHVWRTMTDTETKRRRRRYLLTPSSPKIQEVLL